MSAHTNTVQTVIDRLVPGRQAQLARLCGVRPQAVARWLQKGRLPPHHAPTVEAATGLTCEQLRPDLRWIRKRGRVIGYTVLLDT